MKDISFLKENLIAHRGIHYLFQENTISAFKQTIDKKYTIELDVHLSKDNQIVVFHDFSLNRLFKENKLIKDLSLRELKTYNIPTINEVLELVNGKVPIIIEIKVTNKILYNKLIELLDQYQGKFAIQSFHSKVLLYFKKIRPNYIRGYLIYSIKDISIITKYILRKRILSYLIKPDFIGINISSLNLSYIQKLRKKYIIIGYTIHNKKEYLKYKDKADNFICDIKNKRLFPWGQSPKKNKKGWLVWY